jgi:hypothetical protein
VEAACRALKTLYIFNFSGKGFRHPCLASELETIEVSLTGEADFVSHCIMKMLGMNSDICSA